MILLIEVVFALIAFVLSVISLKTLNAIKRLGVGKSFWAPILTAGIFFLFGSIVTIFDEAGFSLLTIHVDEVLQVTRLIALSLLACGIYNYSRRVNNSLKEEFSIPETGILEMDAEENVNIEEPARGGVETIIQMRRSREASSEAPKIVCKHEFGFLRTLPKNASIPNECLGCDKIIECKHSV